MNTVDVKRTQTPEMAVSAARASRSIHPGFDASPDGPLMRRQGSMQNSSGIVAVGPT
jgi:hypothetical protein